MVNMLDRLYATLAALWLLHWLQELLTKDIMVTVKLDSFVMSYVTFSSQWHERSLTVITETSLTVVLETLLTIKSLSQGEGGSTKLY